MEPVIEIGNVQYAESRNISVTIPQRTSEYVQYFGNGESLDPGKHHSITNVGIKYNITGYYNVFNNERIQVSTNVNPPTYETRVVTISFPAGLYTVSDILQKFASSFVYGDRIIDFNESTNRFIIKNYGVELGLNIGSYINYRGAAGIQILMGFTYPEPVYQLPNNAGTASFIFRGFSSSTAVADAGNGIFAVNADVPGFFPYSLYTTQIGRNLSNFSSILIGCDLIQQSSLLGPNFLTMFPNKPVANINAISSGQTQNYSEFKTNIPINKLNFSSIKWSLYGITLTPFPTALPMTINVTIQSREKTPTASSIIASNIFFDSGITVQTRIPQLSPDYIQNFNNVISLNTKQKHFITRVLFDIEPNSVYNITKAQALTITTNIYTYTGGTPSAATPPSVTFPIKISVGFYSLDKIVALINGISPPFPIISYNKSGPRAFDTVINGYTTAIPGGGTVKTGSSINFSRARIIQELFGFLEPDNPERIIYASSTLLTGGRALTSVLNYSRDGPVPSPEKASELGHLSVLYLGCDLIKQSSLVSQNHLLITAINGGEYGNFEDTCFVPIEKYNFSSINWKLTDRFGDPYPINKGSNVFLQILSIYM
jgi:hypothetical protein